MPEMIIRVGCSDISNFCVALRDTHAALGGREGEEGQAKQTWLQMIVNRDKLAHGMKNPILRNLAV